MSLASIYSAQLVKIRLRTGVNSYGEPTYATAVDVRGHVEFVNRLIRIPTGEEVVSKATVLLPSTVATAGGMLISVDGGTIYQDVLDLRLIVDPFGTLQHYEALI